MAYFPNNNATTAADFGQSNLKFGCFDVKSNY